MHLCLIFGHLLVCVAGASQNVLQKKGFYVKWPCFNYSIQINLLKTFDHVEYNRKIHFNVFKIHQMVTIFFGIPGGSVWDSAGDGEKAFGNFTHCK